LQQYEVLELIEDTQFRLIQDYPFLEAWSVGFDRAKRRAGVCKLNSKEICISYQHIENNYNDVVLDTLLHEFAHAIAFELYQDRGHGRRWKEIASLIGAAPKATGKFNLPDSPWMLVSVCNIDSKVEKITPRYRRNKNIRHYALRGNPGSKGSLYYVKTEALDAYEKGMLKFEQLEFVQ